MELETVKIIKKIKKQMVMREITGLR